MSSNPDLLRRVVDALPLPVFVAKVPSGLPEYSNKMFTELMGLEADPEADLQAYQSAYGVFDREGEPYSAERMPVARVMQSRAAVLDEDMVIHRRDGSNMNLRVWGRPLFDDDGTMTHVMVVFTDTTESTLVEERLSKIAALTPVAIGMSRVSDGALLYANESMAEIMDRPIEELLGKSSLAVLYDEPSTRDEVIGQIRETGAFHGEIWLRRGDGRRIRASTHIRSTSLRGEACLLGTILDVTSLHQVEAELRKSLSEKDILLKEVHHRVKNSLQIVSSILALQSSTSKIPEIQTTLDSCRGRISAIAAVHEALYQGPTLSHLQLDKLLRNVARGLQQALSRDRHELEVEFELASLQVDIDTAVPIGLIVTELVSNALRHAFLTDSGHIRITLDDEDDHLVIGVADNGKGMPDARDAFASLGLRLVDTLVGQLGGTMSNNSQPGKGTSYSVRVPKRKP